LDLDRLALTHIKTNERDVDMTEERAVEAIVVCGVPGSGKTTFAHGLARRLHWALLDLDTLTNPLFQYAGGEFLVDVPSPGLNVRASINDIRYTCLFDTAQENLALGINVILVAPFTSERVFPEAWARLTEYLAIPGHRVHLAWLDTPPAEVVKRMQLRGAARDIKKLKESHRFLTPDVTAPPRVAHTRVDGLQTPTEQIEHFFAEFSGRAVLL
jgi:predicted kinase